MEQGDAWQDNVCTQLFSGLSPSQTQGQMSVKTLKSWGRWGEGSTLLKAIG